MLVLSRKIGEQILIAEDVEIVIQSIQGSRVVLGINAPRATRVLRGELQQDRTTAGQNSTEVVGSLALTACLADSLQSSNAIHSFHNES